MLGAWCLALGVVCDMGHMIHAVISKRPCSEHKAVDLPQGFFLTPVTHSFLDKLDDALEATAPHVDGFIYLGGALRPALERESRLAPLVYVETDYFGGTGTQSAALFEAGELTFAEAGKTSGAINRALLRLGVRRRFFADAFDTLGLGAFRTMDRFEDDTDRGE